MTAKYLQSPWLKGNDDVSDEDLDVVCMEMPPEDQ